MQGYGLGLGFGVRVCCHESCSPSALRRRALTLTLTLTLTLHAGEPRDHRRMVATDRGRHAARRDPLSRSLSRPTARGGHIEYSWGGAPVLALPLHSSRPLPTLSLSRSALRLYPRTWLGRARREAASCAQSVRGSRWKRANIGTGCAVAGLGRRAAVRSQCAVADGNGRTWGRAVRLLGWAVVLRSRVWGRVAVWRGPRAGPLEQALALARGPRARHRAHRRYRTRRRPGVGVFACICYMISVCAGSPFFP